MMHAANQQQWPFHRASNGLYRRDADNDDIDDEAAAAAATGATVAVDEDDFGDYGLIGEDSIGAGRRYLTVQPKQWCTSYVANRQHYIHSTESVVNHNGGIGIGTGIGLDNDVYGGRTMVDFFRSKTMPRRTAAGTMMEDYGNGNDGDGNGATIGVGNGGSNNQWPISSADIVEYDSSLAPDTPTLQQQQSQFVLPQQQRQRTNKLLQNDGTSVTTHSNAGYGGKSTIISAVVEDSANGGSRSNFKWKARALYAFLVCLLAVVIINLTLTLWFIRVTQFTSEGMGTMKITHGGLRLSGRTLITDRLVASAIRSRAGRPLLFESTANITLTARNPQGRLLNSLKLTKDGLECAQASVFRVTDTRGETLFSADRNQVIVGAQELRVTGSGGAVFQGSVQTPMVRADSRHDLRLESTSRKLELSGPQGVTIESRAGDITVSCLTDVKLQSISGAIQIDAAKVFFKDLKTGKTSTNSIPVQSVSSIPLDEGSRKYSGAGKRGVEDKLPSVYQLCVCGNGKVFMSPPDGQCAADNESLVCR